MRAAVLSNTSKPHGALYHRLHQDLPTLELLCQSMREWPGQPNLMLMAGPAGQQAIECAKAAGIFVIKEAFADRAYESDGRLRSRELPGAVLTDWESIETQADGIRAGKLELSDGQSLSIEANTLCIHSDSPGALEMAQRLNAWSNSESVKLGGHRGSGISDQPHHPRPSPWQENSTVSIDQAFAMGADFVELDWVWDGQGQGWICHSMALEQHFPEQQGFLDQLPTQAVTKLRGFLGEPLLSLGDAIRYYGHRAVNLEIKGLKGCQRERVSFSNKPAPNIGLQTGGYLVLIRSIYSKQRTVGRIYK